MSTTAVDRRHAQLKRVFDLLLLPLVVAVAIPIMLVIAVAVFVTNGRPVLFRQQRVGRHGRRFVMYKFRTMVPDAEAQQAALLALNERQGPLFKVGVDPRVTALGRFLRETSLDELPQLFNVVAGQMSLVGPRPALPHETEAFPEDFRDARARVRPGMTGPWQLWGRDDACFERYQELDLAYVSRWKIRTDLSILVATLPAVVHRAFRRRAVLRTKPLQVDASTT